jgi:hypothetical protein
VMLQSRTFSKKSVVRNSEWELTERSFKWREDRRTQHNNGYARPKGKGCCLSMGKALTILLHRMDKMGVAPMRKPTKFVKEPAKRDQQRQRKLRGCSRRPFIVRLPGNEKLERAMQMRGPCPTAPSCTEK